MVLCRIGVLSAAKMLGAVYALLGLLVGAFFSLIAVAGAALNAGGPGPQGFPISFVGIAAIIVMPIMYGIGGFVGGAVSAALYNLVAGFAGGIEMDFQRRGPTEAPAAGSR